jgi:hypothetical protein
MTELISMKEAVKLDLENMKKAEERAEEKLFNYFEGIAGQEEDFLDDESRGIDFLERVILSLKIYAERKTKNPESSIYKALNKLVDYLEEDRENYYLDFTWKNIFTKEYKKDLGKYMAENTAEEDPDYLLEIVKEWNKKAEDRESYRKMTEHVK